MATDCCWSLLLLLLATVVVTVTADAQLMPLLLLLPMPTADMLLPLPLLLPLLLLLLMLLPKLSGASEHWPAAVKRQRRPAIAMPQRMMDTNNISMVKMMIDLPPGCPHPGRQSPDDSNTVFTTRGELGGRAQHQFDAFRIHYTQ